MDSGPSSWELPPGPVRRQLKDATGLDITAADFAPYEADQLRLWAEGKPGPTGNGSGRHSAGGRRQRRRRGHHR